MELIPVLDIAGGIAVHAVGGERSHYEPVQSVLTPDVQGDALALARAYRFVTGVRRCYVADLDAIGGRRPQHQLMERLRSDTGFGGPLLVDSGVSSVADLRCVAAAHDQVVVGLETLDSFDDLAAVAAEARVTFSLDLRHELPLARQGVLREAGSTNPLWLARCAAQAGAHAIILLDLGRVGRGAGVNLELLAALRRALPGVQVLAGGGVRNAGDLAALAECGCDGALVATALHRGTLAAGDPGSGQSGASDVR